MDAKKIITKFNNWISSKSKDEELIKKLKRYVNNLDEDYINNFMDEEGNFALKTFISDISTHIEKSPAINFSGTRSLKIGDEIYEFPSIKSEELPEDWDF